MALQVNSSGKVDAGTGDDVTQKRQLTDTPVLELDVSQTFEVLLIAIGNDLERIEEATLICVVATMGGSDGAVVVVHHIRTEVASVKTDGTRSDER